MEANQVLVAAGAEMLARGAGFYGPPVAPSPVPETVPVKSMLEIAAEREARSRQVMRGYSLTVMLRKAGIRRSIPGNCTCGKTISANKTHCAGCAPKE